MPKDQELAAAAQSHSPVPWTESEKTKLVELVTQDGTGKWKAKADALNTGRTVEAVSRYWNANKDKLIAEDTELAAAVASHQKKRVGSPPET
eukprot:COSAG06_NODE_3433_length_5355_cov_6.170282_2_plen_92_part_00